MHIASYDKMKSFLRVYEPSFPRNSGKVRVLEVGSKSYREQDTYRLLIDDATQTYTGLDLEAGNNVDIVPAKAYTWEEIPDDSFDVCVSGQTFEHNPFFWVTACEIARVLVPGGYVCIIAPGGGKVHRYPMDCYRYYPDSWSAIAAIAGLEVIEVYFETDQIALNASGGQWRDSMLIARKPTDVTDAADAKKRREQVTQPFREGFGAFEVVGHKHGPAVAAYIETVPQHKDRPFRAKLARRIAPFAVGKLYRAD